MADNSEISWTDHTWSPWEGCQKVGPGCDNCYAEARNQRFAAGSNWGQGAPRRKTAEASWRKPLQWAKQAKASGARPRVFPSLCDPFDNAVDPAWRHEFFDLIGATPELTWLLLTKRIGNAKSMVPAWLHGELPINVWLGATVINQQEADRDIPKLLAVRATRRFLSIEPLLGPIDLRELTAPDGSGRTWDALSPCGPASIDWVIAGGESGPKARPTHPDWLRSLRDQCASAGVAFHFKQWGEWAPVAESAVHPEATRIPGNLCRVTRDGITADHYVATSMNGGRRRYEIRRLGKKDAGRLLDGVEHNGFPA